jgi:hypothetical protein
MEKKLIVCPRCGQKLNERGFCVNCALRYDENGIPHITALTSFRAIMKVVDKPRPFDLFDFVPESYIPNI